VYKALGGKDDYEVTSLINDSTFSFIMSKTSWTKYVLCQSATAEVLTNSRRSLCNDLAGGFGYFSLSTNII